MKFIKNGSKICIAAAIMLAFPFAAYGDNLINTCSFQSNFTSKVKYGCNDDYSGSSQEWAEEMKNQRNLNEIHIKLLQTIYRGYLKDENNQTLSSLLEENSSANSLEDLQSIGDKINSAKNTFEENRTKAIAEAEAKKKATEYAATMKAQSDSQAVTTQSYAGNDSNSYSSSGETYQDAGDAKSWIIQKESGGNYNAQNGRYYGAYQLDRSYLNGDYSKENQDRTAENYVANRYGSWENAKAFWEQNGWY